MRDLQDVSYFATTNHRNSRVPFGIRQRDRLQHMYVIGKTGVGKSTLLENLMLQDLDAGRGLMLLDPHGELLEAVKNSVSQDRLQDLVVFDPTDPENNVGFNPVHRVDPAKLGLAAGGLLDALKKLWKDSWGPRLEHLLRNAIFTLLEQPQGTLADLLRLFQDKAFQLQALRHVQNEQVQTFWLAEWAKHPERLRAEALSPLQNKVGAFLTDPVLNRVLCKSKMPLRLREIMDNKKILLVNLSKGKLGEDTSALLGALLVSRLNLAALSRAELPATERQPFYVFLDEFQSFASLAFITMLSELRKYKVGVTLAHQYLAQLEPDILGAVLGNVGTHIVFRIGVADAEVLEREFQPYFSVADLTMLPNHHIYLKLLIDGALSRPFSAATIASPVYMRDFAE